MFKKRKLVLRKKDSMSYGRNPNHSQTVIRSRNNKLLRTKAPTSFHTRRNKKPLLKKISSLLPKRLLKFTKIIAISAAVFGAIYLGLVSSYFKIDEIKVVTEDVTQANLTNNITGDLRDFRHKNILFIDEEAIRTIIQDKYPEIENVEISTDLPSTLIISFSQFPSIANITNITDEANKKYIINSIGYVVQEDIENPGLPYIKIRTETPLNTQAQILDKEKLTYIMDSKNYFEEKFGMNIIEVDYLITPREVHLKTEKHFYIWLDVQKPYEEQLKKLKKALVKLDIYSEPLQYIDLRITGESGEKIIYKRR